MKALSIQQPWAWLIVSGFKDIENRSWPTKYRGPVLIHAGLKSDGGALADLVGGEHPVTGEKLNTDARKAVDEMGLLPFGGIVGEAEIVDCVTASDSRWWMGPYGFVIRNARPLPFQPCRGMLGFFEPDFTPPTPKPERPKKTAIPPRQAAMF
jgi:hypothetical protein